MMKIKERESLLSRFKSKVKNTKAPDEVPKVKLLFAIIESGYADEVADVLFDAGVRFDLLLKGMGTANSQLLNMLGLGTSARDILLATIDAAYSTDIMELIYDVCKSSGIVFSVSLKSVGGRNILKLMQGDFSNDNSNGQ